MARNQPRKIRRIWGVERFRRQLVRINNKSTSVTIHTRKQNFHSVSGSVGPRTRPTRGMRRNGGRG